MNRACADDVDQLIVEFLTALEMGQAPDPAEWLARHPTHAAELAAFFADLSRFAPLLGLPAPPADLDRTVTSHPAQPSGPDPHPETRFGEYELLEQLGAGGMGVVYRARAATSLVVALKRLKPGIGGDEARRFLVEVQAVIGLKHPNIVPVYHTGEHAGRPYYTMPILEGGSLDQQLARFQADPRAAAQLVLKVARAVHHAHQRQIVHRDLKPANILLDATGEPQVADFGLAARLDAAAAADAGAAGSLPWMAPEAVRGEPVTTGVDVWALGVILYELLSGTRPFQGANWAELRGAILNSTPRALRNLNPQVPLDLAAICECCLMKEPDRRYESASAVALELERWLQDRRIRKRTPSRRERVARWFRHNPVLGWGGLLLAIMLVGGAVLGGVLADEQAAALRKAACQANEHTAWHVANSVLRKFDDLGEPVFQATDDTELQLACRSQNRTRVEDRLRALFKEGQTPFETVYVLDGSGTIVALIEPGRRGPPAVGVVGKAYPARDYFQGARKRSGEQKLDRVHVSRVFHSNHDGKDKFALSCAFQPSRGTEDIWVLAATITTDDTLGLIKLQDGNQKTALLAPRDPSSARLEGEPEEPGYLILVHEAFRGRKGTPCVYCPAGRPVPVPDPGARPELRLPDELGAPPFPQDSAYRDPVAAHGYPDYEGRWLTGSARVGNTEMVVLVQEKDEAAVAPQRAFFARFAAWTGGVLGGGLVAFVGFAGLRARRAGTGPREET